jgi:hypothetical protein
MMSVRITLAVAAAVAVAAVALAGCSSGGEPLANGTAQEGMRVCVPAPNPGDPASTAWDSVIGFTGNYYYNPSSAPVVIESVSLLGAHNLVLREVAVYQMRHAEHPLGSGFAWSRFGRYADPVAWTHRPKPGTRDEYQIAVGITATTPRGGWAIGHQVTYRQGNRQYTIRTYTGYAIAPPGKTGQPRCDAEMAAITGAWPAP